MKFFKCVNCNFNVTEQDERCLNCGVLYPLKSLEITDKNFLPYVVIGTAVPWLLFILTMFLIGQKRGNDDWIFISACITPVLLIVTFIISGFVFRLINDSSKQLMASEIAKRTKMYLESLTSKETIIEQRKSELSHREQKINAVLNKAKLNNDKDWKQICFALEGSIKTLKRQKAKYDLKFIEIQMVRLQNKLAPFVYYTDGFSYGEIGNILNVIEQAKEEVNGINNWINRSTFLSTISELNELRHRLTEIQESTQKLHNAFLGKQAVLALQDFSPLDDAVSPVLPPVDAIKESDVFNIQVSITDFSSSFRELESEYLRIQAEEDIAKQVNKIINDTNKTI